MPNITKVDDTTYQETVSVVNVVDVNSLQQEKDSNIEQIKVLENQIINLTTRNTIIDTKIAAGESVGVTLEDNQIQG